MTRTESTEKELCEKGWKFDHPATIKGYLAAGSVSQMRSRHGYEYCRVHTSKTKHCGQYQITIVYRRKLQ